MNAASESSQLASSSNLNGSVASNHDAADAGSSAAFSDRVRLYLKVTTLINVSFALVSTTLVVSGLAPNNTDDQGARTLIIWSVTALNAMAWFAIARSRHSERTALVTEVVATLALACAYAGLLFTQTQELERADQVAALLLVTIILVLRASLVPSPTVATAVVGTLVVLFVAVYSHIIAPHIQAVYHFWNGVLGAVVVAVTTVTSQTIYGLHERMQAAKRLGQYKLDRRVGQGSMGEVYLATHSLLQRQTAVKLLRDVTSSVARDRFRQEVQTASALSHPNTVEIYDYGRTPDGIFYFAMEYVEGASLEELVAAAGPVPTARAAHFLAQAAGSLAEAHARGLVHRDIKPSNLMVCERGGDFDTLKVLDFGLVRDLGDAEQGRESELSGTPLYLAPEAILDGQGYVPESDVYALSATGYFLLTGAPPFIGASLAEVLSDHLATKPSRPEVDDEALVELILRGLSKEPSQRPQDAAEFLVQLKQCASLGAWSSENARIWWAEHREQVEVARPSIAAGSRQALVRQSATGRTM